MEIQWEKINKTATCWNWTGHIRQGGYGEIMIKGKKYRAHRLVYETLKEKIPDGLVLDHLCRNRKCVNPEHLEVVTQVENVIRGEGIGMRMKRRTHCIRGHLFAGHTLKQSKKNNPYRICKICKSIRQKKWKDSLKDK
jgi:hypothetical protein